MFASVKLIILAVIAEISSVPLSFLVVEIVGFSPSVFFAVKLSTATVPFVEISNSPLLIVIISASNLALP